MVMAPAHIADNDETLAKIREPRVIHGNPQV